MKNLIYFIILMINNLIIIIYDNNNINNSNTKFNIDNNLIPTGFLLFILSMLIYFIDLTS